jgi:hypothetical protein
MNDIKDIVDSQSQTDPSFKTKRLYRRISSDSNRQQLMIQKDYDEQELPCEETILCSLNELGYHPKKVRKCQPLKKIPFTSAIFEQLYSVPSQNALFAGRGLQPRPKRFMLFFEDLKSSSYAGAKYNTN